MSWMRSNGIVAVAQDAAIAATTKVVPPSDNSPQRERPSEQVVGSLEWRFPSQTETPNPTFSSVLPLAGFKVSCISQFWVSPEGAAFSFARILTGSS